MWGSGWDAPHPSILPLSESLSVVSIAFLIAKKGKVGVILDRIIMSNCQKMRSTIFYEGSFPV